MGWKAVSKVTALTFKGPTIALRIQVLKFRVYAPEPEHTTVVSDTETLHTLYSGTLDAWAMWVAVEELLNPATIISKDVYQIIGFFNYSNSVQDP